jgi:histidine ammonia-lyase
LASARALGGDAVKIAEVAALSLDGGQVVLSAQARRAIAESQDIVARHVESEGAVYGLNTGLGGNLDHRVPRLEIEAFQVQILRGRMIGVGAPLQRRLCRAALLCRIIELSSGRTGVSEQAIDVLIAMFNRGVTPVVPRYGSISASDIGLVAHLAAPAVGLGEAWFKGKRMAGAAALAAAGIEPARLQAKDGLGLVSHGAVTSASAALALTAIGDLLVEQAAVAALAFEGYRGNPSIFDPRLHAVRPAAGQVAAAQRMRRMLRGSYLYEAGAPAKIQDALCFREIAPVMGTAMAAHAAAVAELEIELNGVTCSPLVLLETEQVLSSPNFHPSSLALALDALTIALTHAASASALRICKLMTHGFSGLPRYLSPAGGGSAGYVSLQKTAGALYAEIRLRATATLLDALAVSDMVEDMAPNAFLASRKLEEQLAPLRYLSAIEAAVGAQAVDLREVATKLAVGPRRVHAAIRRKVPPLEQDREPGRDVEAARLALDSRGLRAALRRICAQAGGPHD